MYSLVIPPDLIKELYEIRERSGISIRKQILDACWRHVNLQNEFNRTRGEKCSMCGKKDYPLVSAWRDGKYWCVCHTTCEIKDLKENKKNYIKNFGIKTYNKMLNVANKRTIKKYNGEKWKRKNLAE